MKKKNDADLSDLVDEFVLQVYPHVPKEIITDYLSKAFDRGMKMGMAAADAFSAIENEIEWDIKDEDDDGSRSGGSDVGC